jgi:hypothetical protein
MLRKGMLVIALIVASQAPCFGQGLLDSIFGPSGLGVWSGNSSSLTNQQFQSPSPQQLPSYPNQQYQGTASPQNPYYNNQQGVYSDWQTPRPTTAGSTGQVRYPTQQQYQVPQYSNQPQDGRRWVRPPQQMTPQRQPVQAQMQPMLPRQYPPGPPVVSPEDLPAGSVRITTTTPSGTTVQFYPPAGEQAPAPGVAPPVPAAAPHGPRHIRVKRSTGKRAIARTIHSNSRRHGPTAQPSGIAMPKPVEVPQGDPRYQWGVNQAPVAPQVR